MLKLLTMYFAVDLCDMLFLQDYLVQRSSYISCNSNNFKVSVLYASFIESSEIGSINRFIIYRFINIVMLTLLEDRYNQFKKKKQGKDFENNLQKIVIFIINKVSL